LALWLAEHTRPLLDENIDKTPDDASEVSKSLVIGKLIEK
jgi:hypothetical protein